MANAISNLFLNQLFAVEHQVTTEVKGIKLIFTVSDIQFDEEDNADESDKVAVGLLTKQTQMIFEKGLSSNVRIKGEGTVGRTTLFNKEFNFSDLGIGGLDKEFQIILRRAFTSRVYPPKIAKNLGLKHVKGILLYGPPGTGKTLIARQIGKMLNAREPKLVNGPEILDKYYGEAERKIRELFSDAEEEQRLRGDDSDLHIIIFDEIDAICRQRGTTQSGIGDSIVNQLLSKMQGVEELNNILVIGMTNRRDMLDEALLRPGRLEVHLEINLPDEHGRKQIFEIHTERMRKHGYLDKSVDLKYLAARTKNYSGAEIEGVVRSAASFAMSRKVDILNPSKLENPEDIRVTLRDFELALEEVKPAFGIADDSINKRIKNGIVEYSSTFKKVLNECSLYVDQVRNSERTPLLSFLLEGDYGSGKTALACKIAKDSNFPFIQIISPDDLVGHNEASKLAKIQKTFDNAYKSPYSIIILDEIERLLDYVRIGPRFSNVILQALFVYLKKYPEHIERKLLIIGTTSSPHILEEMELTQAFDARINVPNVCGPEELKTVLKEYDVSSKDAENIASKLDRIQFPIKKLIMAIEKSKYGKDGDFAGRFINSVRDFNF